MCECLVFNVHLEFANCIFTQRCAFFFDCIGEKTKMPTTVNIYHVPNLLSEVIIFRSFFFFRFSSPFGLDKNYEKGLIMPTPDLLSRACLILKETPQTFKEQSQHHINTHTHTPFTTKIMAKYAWYTKVTDAAHRLTVLSLIGFSLYMSGGLAYNLYMNGKKYEQKQLASKEQAESEAREKVMKD